VIAFSLSDLKFGNVEDKNEVPARAGGGTPREQFMNLVRHLFSVPKRGHRRSDSVVEVLETHSHRAKKHWTEKP
jgi:hypothetical protein